MNTSTVIITSVGLFLRTSVVDVRNVCNILVGTSVRFRLERVSVSFGTGVFLLEWVLEIFGQTAFFYVISNYEARK